MTANEARSLSVTLPPHGGEGAFGLPAGRSRGILVFADGTGSSRFSRGSASVAEALQRAGLVTLLFDSLTASDAMNASNVTLPAERLDAAATWTARISAGRDLPLGFFGAVAGRGHLRAVVSLGGRPDLAAHARDRVAIPPLPIVGGHDPEVRALNDAAYRQIRRERRLKVVPGATHPREGPGTLEAMVDLARDWFLQHPAGESGETEHAVHRSA